MCWGGGIVRGARERGRPLRQRSRVPRAEEHGTQPLTYVEQWCMCVCVCVCVSVCLSVVAVSV